MHLAYRVAHKKKKSHVEFQPDWFTIFREKLNKVKKRMNCAQIMPNYARNRHHFHCALHLYIVLCEILVRSLTYVFS